MLFDSHSFFPEMFKGKDCIIYSAHVSDEIKAFYGEKINDPVNQLIIYPFLRGTSQSPYIPGSSIKGALRTGVIFDLFDNQFDKQYLKKIKGKKGNILEAFLLKCERGWNKRLDPQKDPFRCIKIVDTTLPQDSTIIQRVRTVSKKDKNIKLMNIQLIKETTYSEFTGRTLSITTEIKYDEQLIKRNMDIKKKIILQDIIDANKVFSEKLIDCELRYFNNHPTAEVYERLKAYWSGLKENEFMFWLGWGSGYNSMTVNLKSSTKPIKTRKLINELIPLGWIKGKIELIS